MEQLERTAERLRLGTRLRAARTTAGLSRNEVAALLQLSPRRIGAVERGAATIDALDLWRLAARLGAPVNSFFDSAPEAATGAVGPTVYEVMVTSDDGANLAEAFAQLKTPRLRRHLVKLAEELVAQETLV